VAEAVEAPAEEAPAEEAPVEEAPAAESMMVAEAVEAPADETPVVEAVPADTSDPLKRFWLVVKEPSLIEARDGTGRFVLSGMQGVTKGRRVYGEPPFFVVTDNPAAVQIFYDGWRRRLREDLGNGRFQARFPGGLDFIPGETPMGKAQPALIAVPQEQVPQEQVPQEQVPQEQLEAESPVVAETDFVTSQESEPVTAEEVVSEPMEIEEASADAPSVEDLPVSIEEAAPAPAPAEAEVPTDASSDTAPEAVAEEVAEFVPDPTDKLKRFWLIVTEPTVIDATDSLGRVVLSGEQRVTEGRRIYGEPPFRVESTNPAGFKIYYDGWRQRAREDLGGGRYGMTFPSQGAR
ncbi:MAG: RodZ domain-containing protein, partial [Steroidobacteraceae bacterium]